jgi:hypothetical protein
VVFKPTKEFHTVRHTLYSADENMEIDKVVPAAASGAGFVGVHSSHQTGSIHPLKTTKCRSFSTASYIAREHWLNGQDDSGAVHR